MYFTDSCSLGAAGRLFYGGDCERRILVTHDAITLMRLYQINLLYGCLGQDLLLGVQHEQERRRGIQARPKHQPVAVRDNSSGGSTDQNSLLEL